MGYALINTRNYITSGDIYRYFNRYSKLDLTFPLIQSTDTEILHLIVNNNKGKNNAPSREPKAIRAQRVGDLTQ